MTEDQKEFGEHAEGIMAVTTAPQIDTSPAALLHLGVSQGLDLDKLERMMELQIKWDENQARKAFYDNLAECRKNLPRVKRDLFNNQYNSWYASLGNLMETTNPHLGEHGFSTRFEITANGENRTVRCYLTHRLGHSEYAEETGGPDKSGAKNPLQERKSTFTYLRAITYEAVVGTAGSNDGTLDDDGNAVGEKPPPEKKDLKSGTKNWTNAISAYKRDGNFDEIEKRVNVSDANKKVIKELADAMD